MARVSQRFIDLLNVPSGILKTIAEDHGIEKFEKMRRWELADAVSELPLSQAELEAETQGYLYAGQTSVGYFRFEPKPKKNKDGEVVTEPVAWDQDLPDGSLTGVGLAGDDVRAALNALSAGGDAFRADKTPTVDSRTPKFVVARPRTDGSLLLSFAAQRPAGRVISNFVADDVTDDDFFNAVLFPGTGLIEVRANPQIRQRFARTWLSEFLKPFDLVPVPVTITVDDYAALKSALSADTVDWTGRPEDGRAVGLVRMKVSDYFDDLEPDEEFREKQKGYKQVQGNLEFEHDSANYTLVNSTLQHSIYYAKPASETVMAHVREALLRIKVRHLNPGAE